MTWTRYLYFLKQHVVKCSELLFPYYSKLIYSCARYLKFPNHTHYMTWYSYFSQQLTSLFYKYTFYISFYYLQNNATFFFLHIPNFTDFTLQHRGNLKIWAKIQAILQTKVNQSILPLHFGLTQRWPEVKYVTRVCGRSLGVYCSFFLVMTRAASSNKVGVVYMSSRAHELTNFVTRGLSRILS